MTASEYDEYILPDLPDDPELAFFELEKIFRVVVKSDRSPEAVARYTDSVFAARDTLGVRLLTNLARPGSVSQHTQAWLSELQRAIETAKTVFRIKHTRRVSKIAVTLGPKTKEKLSHYVTQIREIFQNLEISEARREALFKRLNELQTEIDRNRTRFDSFGALVIDLAGTIGVAAEKLEPARKIVDSMAKLIWGEKEAEQKQLPAPQTPKQIEHRPSDNDGQENKE